MAGAQNPYADIAEPAAPQQTASSSAGMPTSSNPYADIAEATPAQPASDWRDRMQQSIQNGYLNDLGLKPGASQEEIEAAEAKTSPIKKLMHHAALHAVSSSLNMATHPLDTIGQGARQAYDAAVVGGNQAGIIPDQWAENSRNRLAATTQQVMEQAQNDPGGLAGDLLGQSAMGEIGGELLSRGVKATAKIAKGVKNAVAKAPEAIGRTLTGTDASATRSAVRDIEDKNVAAAKKAADDSATAAATHDAAVAQANEQNPIIREQAMERSRQLHSEAVNAQQAHQDVLAAQHAGQVQDIQSANEAAQTAADTQNAQDLQQAQAQHEQDTVDAADTESQRGQLARKAIELKNRLAQHVQNFHQTVRGSLDNRFNAVREKIGDAETEVRPLSDVAAIQQKGLSDTADQKGIFNAIIDKAKSESATDEMRDTVARQDYDANSYDELPQEHKEAVDETVANANAGEDIDPQTINFGTLRRFSSKLGRAIADSSDDYVSRSLKAVKNKADAMAQQMANQAGVGAEHSKLMNDWRNYKSTFKEPTGPSGSGSQVAQSVDAQDISNATSPFTSEDSGVASRARQMLVGSGAEGSYYNPKGGKLVDALRDVQRRQKELPSRPIDVKPFEAPTPVQPKLAALPDRPQPPLGTPTDPAYGYPTTTQSRIVQPGEDGLPKQLEPGPAPPPVIPKEETLTAEQQQQANRTHVLDKVKAFRAVSAYRLGAIALGTVSLASGLAGLVSDVHINKGYGLGGSMIIAVAPKLIARMLESDKVLNTLSRPTLGQYREIMKLPEHLRAGVQEAMIDLTDKARAQGKITGPNKWKIAFKVGIGATRPPVTTPQNPQQEAHYVGEQQPVQ